MTRAWTWTQLGCGIAAAAALHTAQLIAAAPARACSCEDTSGALLWPRGDAIDVPVDTPIVVQRRSFSADPSSIPIRLMDAQGDEVELTETRRLEQLEPECWAEQTVFLRPAEPLAASATYSVIVGQGAARSFTTGSGSRRPPNYPLPSVRYAHVGPDGECPDHTGWCNIAEVQVSFAAPIPDGLWLVLRSHADKDNENRWVFASPEWDGLDPSPQLSVVLPSDDRCVELTLYGADGSVAHERELCEPDTCVLFANRGSSSCGEPPSSSLNVDRLPRGNCDAPITIQDGSQGPVYPDPVPELRDDAGAVSPTADAGEPPPAVDAGEPPPPASTGGSPATGPDPSSGGSDSEPEPRAAKRATGCTCGVVGRGASPSPFAAWFFALVAALRLARRHSTTDNR